MLSLLAPVVYADGGAPQLAYVSGPRPGIQIIDIARRRVTGTIVAEGSPGMILLSPDGQALYVTQPESGQVEIITARTRKVLCTAQLPGQPSLLALSLDASVLYVAGRGDTQVRAMDPTNCGMRRTFETHQPVYGLAVSAATSADATPSTPNQLWITGSTALSVFEVDGHLLGTVPIVGGPGDISIPGGFTAYVTTRQGSVVAIDLSTRKVIRTLISGGQFGPMDYDAVTGEVYVPDRQHNQLDVLLPVIVGAPATTARSARIIHLSGSPRSIAITSDGQFGFVALANGQVLMLDIPGRNQVTSITVGGVPAFIITGLYPPEGSPPVATQVPKATNQISASVILSAGLLLLCLVSLLLLWFVWRSYRKRFGDRRSEKPPS